jgi:hypothetical protein
MPKCKNCGRVYADWRTECPDCGFRPPKQSRPITPYLAAIGIVAIVIIIYVIFFWGGGIGSGGTAPIINNTTQTTTTVTTVPTPTGPQCTVGPVSINANKLANDKIRITVMGDPKSSLVHDFTIRLNNKILDTNLGVFSGASVDIQGTGGQDYLVIVANSTCGVESTVLNEKC